MYVVNYIHFCFDFIAVVTSKTSGFIDGRFVCIIASMDIHVKGYTQEYWTK